MLLGVDVGGTFTDAVLVADGVVHTAKAPTTPDDQSRGRHGRRRARARGRGRASAGDVEGFAHGMTVATNALLEGTVARTALVATEGFTDVVALGRQARRELYRLCAAHPAPLDPPERRFAARERTGPRRRARAAATTSTALVDAVAGCRARGGRRLPAAQPTATPSTSARSATRCAERLGVHVSLSHEVVGTFREFERAATTEVDAALSPLLGALPAPARSSAPRDAGLPDPGDHAVQRRPGRRSTSRPTTPRSPSSAARPAARPRRPCSPSAAASPTCCASTWAAPRATCASSRAAACARRRRARSAAGRWPCRWSTSTPSAPAAARSAGATRAARCASGPRSAGAEPGPGVLRARRHRADGHRRQPRPRPPRAPTSPLAGDVALDADAAHAAVERAGRRARARRRATCAEGIVRVANAEMVRALRVMTVERGIDPRRFALLAFGGAGPLHAAAIAEELGMTKILVPRASGVLSALGLAAADRRADAAAHGPRPTTTRASTRCATRSRAALGGEPEVEVAWDVRYRGQSHELTVARRRARRAARALRGAARGALRLPRPRRRGRARHRPRHRPRCPARDGRLRGAAGEEVDRARPSSRCPRRRSSCPRAGAATTDDTGTLVLERRRERRPHRPAGHRRRAARRVRGDGRRARALGPQRQHQGAPRLLDRALRRRRRDGHAGRAHPGPPRRDARRGRRRARPRPRRRASRGCSTTPTRGGTHLPDITVVTPAFHDGELLGFAAARAHHADVGGRVPGSMPADSTTLEEEGVVIAPRVLDDAAIDELAEQMRQPAQRRADLRAQLAANRAGARAAAASSPTASALDVPARGDGRRARLRRAAHARVPGGARRRHARARSTCSRRREGDLELRVAATVDGDELTLDFSGSRRPVRGQPQLPAGGHARARACSPSACSPTPTSRPARAPTGRSRSIAPEGSLLNARSPAAVAGGNVETSLARRRPRARAPSAAPSARGR